jgi:hypothetical protein
VTGEPQGPDRLRKLALNPGPLRIRPGSQARAVEQSPGARDESICCHRHDRLHDSAPCTPAHVVTVTAHCPGAIGTGKGQEALAAVQRVLDGAQSIASDIEPLDPRPHPPPCVYVHLSVDGFYTCCGCTLRDDDDDFEEYSTAAIIDHLREHQAAGHTFHILTDAFDDLQARLTPPRTMRGSRQRARTADHDYRSRRRPTC